MELKESLFTLEEVIMWLDTQAMFEVCTMDNIVIWERTPGKMLIFWDRAVAFGPANPL